MIAGARQGRLSGLRRLTALAMARDLRAFLVPGPEIARAHGLDIEAAGLLRVASPRHASVLLVVGAIPPALREAAAIVYAQMVRPRALFALGTQTLSPLPAADVGARLSQDELVEGVHRLRRAFAEGAFRPQVSSFDTPILHVRIQYTCPMHPEVIRDEPGTCPKCGMTLVPHETRAEGGSAHRHHHTMDSGTPGQAASEPGHSGHPGMDHAALVQYTCPMHPEVIRDEPGTCPKCGMTLVPHETRAEGGSVHRHHHHTMDSGTPGQAASEPGHSGHPGMDHSAMDHSAMDHGDGMFMSMVEVTRDLPRSIDGLAMDWIDVPFGPFFPGLPGGLQLMLTLDGDTVARSAAHAQRDMEPLLPAPDLDPVRFVSRLTEMDPLSPVSYRLLACRAMEDAAGAEVPDDIARGRVGALERERIASHLGWLALFAQQTGLGWLMGDAAGLQLHVRHADLKRLMGLRPALRTLTRRLRRTPLLKARTAGLGRLAPDPTLRGPVVRATGIGADARHTDSTCAMLGFTAITRTGGDALARLFVRVEEITHSLALIETAGVVERPEPADTGEASGAGEAVVETPRGEARLQLTLDKGRVSAARLGTPSMRHLELVGPLTEGQELGDALVAVGSLDLSPWGTGQ